MKISEIVTVSCRNYVVEFLQENYKVYSYSTPQEFFENGVENAQILIYDESCPNVFYSGIDFFNKHKGLTICISSIFYDRELLLSRFHNFDIVISGPCSAVATKKQLAVCINEIAMRDDLLNCSVSVVNQEKKSAKNHRSINGYFAGISECMGKLHECIRKAAKNDLPVLLLGETGTGKSTAAQLIHQISLRRQKKFKAVDLSGSVESLSESQFYGTAAHAFTDAAETEGLLSETNGGTLFLDEIGNAKLDIQANLLSPLETKFIYKVGSTKQEKIDVRMIFATNADINNLISQGLFKKDLYYRIYDNTIVMPSLKDHLEDLPYMVKEYCLENEVEISDSSVQKLMKHTWPGNLREFYKCMNMATLECGKTEIRPEHIMFGMLR